jgi:prepilin-type N-terminal cleavage/methylation domain-containing protein
MQNKKHSGFTLMEMVVAMSIFMVFLTAVFGTYIQITSTQKKANNNREAVAETREIFSFISDEAKEKAIDYSCYDTGSECIGAQIGNGMISKIVFISKDGLSRTIISVEKNEDEETYKITSAKFTRETTYGQNWIPNGNEYDLHSNNLKIESAKIILTPEQDPFIQNIVTATNEKIQFQPVIHMVLNIKRKAQSAESDPTPIVMETSFSSRIYGTFSSNETNE